MSSAFPGFRPEALDFLVELALNNDRSWFGPRKASYEALLKRPLEELCIALNEEFLARELPLSADPARSPFRIYRDVRFARDKSPYKTNVGASFPWIEHAAGATALTAQERHGPGGYFHLEPGEIFVGGGTWHPEPARLAAFRTAIVEDRARVHAALEEPGFVAAFGAVEGDQLKRIPAGYAADDPDAEWLKLKDVVFGTRLADRDVASPDLPDLLADAFVAAMPVMRFIASLDAQPAATA